MITALGGLVEFLRIDLHAETGPILARFEPWQKITVVRGVKKAYVIPCALIILVKIDDLAEHLIPNLRISPMLEKHAEPRAVLFERLGKGPVRDALHKVTFEDRIDLSPFVEPREVAYEMLVSLLKPSSSSDGPSCPGDSDAAVGRVRGAVRNTPDDGRPTLGFALMTQPHRQPVPSRDDYRDASTRAAMVG